ncbi:MAG: copper chaperone PCu(A)C [Rothia sp. (in: high G+C Gram-positive bacteria)]|nr:copper chaperone PCu(A)C [Rothia sp. (in: high G+C Gram-positive bacteria)]
MSVQKYSLALALSSLLLLSACSSSNTASSSSSSPDASASVSVSAGTETSQSEAASALKVEDAWIKANTQTMTGAFARITNTSDSPITIQGGSSPSASMIELHTTILDPATGQSSMKEVEGGFTLEPGASLDLVPGGDHIMLMGMSCSLLAGSSSTISLQTSAGELSFEAQVRDYAAAQEEYAPGDHSGHQTMAETSSAATESAPAESAQATLPQCA